MHPIVILVLGVILGLALAASLVVSLLRSRMITAHRSRRSFVDTCAAIERLIPGSEGWGFPAASLDALALFREKGKVPEGVRELRFYFLCNAGLASRLLSHTPAFAGMMPCSWAVYELDDGSVWLSKMNVGLMSRMFSGVPGAVMRQVGEADEKFLAQVLGKE